MTIVGIILLVLGLVLPSSLCLILGIVLVVLGLLPLATHSFGRPLGPRRWYY